MKKLTATLSLLSAITIGLHAASVTGTVFNVMVDTNGIPKASFKKADDSITQLKKLKGSGDELKTMLAVILSAKAMGSTVKVKAETEASVNVWGQINIID